jgi:hypothetical protein
MSSLSTIPNDISKEIVNYLDAVSISRLFATFSKRLQFVLRCPGLVTHFWFYRNNDTHDGCILYLLRNLSTVQHVTLHRDSHLTVSQLVALSHIPTVIHLAIDNRLVDIPSEVLALLWGNTKAAALKAVKMPLALVIVSRHVAPDLSRLFPSLKTFICHTIPYIAHLAKKDKANDRTWEMLPTMVVDLFLKSLPPNLTRAEIRMDMNYRLDPYFLTVNMPTSITDLKISASRTNFKMNVDKIVSRLNQLTRLHLSFPNLYSVNRPILEPNHLPQTLMHINIDNIDIMYSVGVLSGKWISFRNLPLLESVSLGFLAQRAIPTRISTMGIPKLDLKEIMPTSIRSLSLSGSGRNSTDSDNIFRLISGLPYSLTSLSIEGANQTTLSRLFEMLKNATQLTTINSTNNINMGFQESDWSLMPSSLRHLNTNGTPFPDDDLFEVSTSSSALATKPGGLIETQMELDKSLVSVATSSSSSSSDTSTTNKTHLSTTSELILDSYGKIKLPTLATIPPKLVWICCSIPCAWIVLQFARQYPQCQLYSKSGTLLDHGFLRILLDEAKMGLDDGSLSLAKIDLFAHRLTPNFLKSLVVLNYDTFYDEICHRSYITTLDLDEVTPTLYWSLTWSQATTNNTMLIHVTSLSINVKNSINLTMFSYPPNLKSLSVKAFALMDCGSRAGSDSCPPPSLTELRYYFTSVMAPAKLPKNPQLKIIDSPKSVYMLHELILAADAKELKFVCCSVVARDSELLSFYKRYKNVTFNISCTVEVSGDLIPSDTKHFKHLTEQQIVDFSSDILSKLNGIVVTQYCLSSNFKLPNCIETLELQDAKLMAKNFNLAPLPPSTKTLIVNGGPILTWDMLAKGLSKDLVTIKLQFKRTKADIVMKTEMPNLLTLRLSSVGSAVIDIDPVMMPILEHLALSSITLSPMMMRGISGLIKPLTKLKTFEFDVAMDSHIKSAFMHHPTIEKVLIDTMQLTGRLLHADIQHVTWERYICGTHESLEGIPLQYQEIELVRPLNYGPNTKNNNIMQSLQLIHTDAAALESSVSPSKFPHSVRSAMRSMPFHSIFSNALPPALVALDFASTSLTSVEWIQIIKVLEFAKSLKALRLDFKISVEGSCWMGHHFPPLLETVHLPQATSSKRTGLVLDLPPSVIDFQAPFLKINVRHSISSTLQSINVANTSELTVRAVKETKTTTKRKQPKKVVEED